MVNSDDYASDEFNQSNSKNAEQYFQELEEKQSNGEEGQKKNADGGSIFNQTGGSFMNRSELNIMRNTSTTNKFAK